MRKLLALLMLAIPAFAVSPKTLSSSVAFTDVSNNVLANGYIVFKLAIGDSLIGGGQLVQGLTKTVTLDVNGLVTAGQTMFGTDQMQSTGNYYVTDIYNSNNQHVRGPENWRLSGASPIDLSLQVNALLPDPGLSNPVLQNPAAAQTITGFGLTLTSSAPLTSAGNNTFVGSNTVANLNGVLTLDGTKYPVTPAGFAQLISDLPSGGTAYIPANVTLSLTSSIPISKNFTLQCANRQTSIINGPTGLIQFNLTGTITQFTIDSCQLGSALGTLSTVGVTSADGRFRITNNLIQHMTGSAITLGTSTFYNTIYGNHFGFNVGDIYIKDNSDADIWDNDFEYPNGSAADITTEGANDHIFHNTFIWGNAGNNGTGPYILLKPRTATYTQSGRNWIENNKFGVEGLQVGHIAIQVSGDANTYMGPTYVINNDFNCLTGNNSTAVQLLTQIHGWQFSLNKFNNCTKLIDDSFTYVTGDYGMESTFDSTNATLDPGGNGSPMTLFTNGGRGFSTVYSPSLLGDTPSFDYNPRVNETAGLMNRLTWSEDFTNAAWVKSGISITTGQTDPWGGTRANLLTRANAATFENVSQAFSVSSLQKQVVVSFWAKAGTTNVLETKVYDYTAAVEVPEKNLFTLNSGWRRYKYTAAGLNTADGFSLYFYPNGESQRSGTVTICCVQVSDIDSDYLPVTAAAVLSNAAGNRYERQAIYNAGLNVAAGATTLNGSTTVGPNGTALTSKIAKYTAVESPTIVGANTCSQQSFSNVTGVASGDIIISVTKPTNQAGLSGPSNAINAGANSVAVNFCNNTAAGITPTASETYTFWVIQ